MTEAESQFPTTYKYSPLPSKRHIRLLQIADCEISDSNATTKYSLVDYEIPPDDTELNFEAISYTWGEPDRVSGLQLEGDVTNQIGLTANLTAALPHLIKNSQTKRLWIDQICISQGDNEEKGVQISLMCEIYKRATRVIIWLGPEDSHDQICKQWLEAIADLIPTIKNSEKVTPGNPQYHADSRRLFLMNTFYDPGTDPQFEPALQKFWGRLWFTRGWICQEFLLARQVLCLAGTQTYTLQDLDDLFHVPTDEKGLEWISYRMLMFLKFYPYTDPAPLRYLRTLAAVAGEFNMRHVVDRLFGTLGIMEGISFLPDYNASTKQNFTRFAVAIARDYGSLDFLSLWAANLDPLVPDTPPEVLGLPSWVPSWTPWPAQAPWRLAVGGVRQRGSEVRWNTALGRKHVHDQDEDAVSTGRLHVRGKIIDRIDSINPRTIPKNNEKYFNADREYINGLVEDLKTHIPGLQDWTCEDFIHFLNVVSSNGSEPTYPTDSLFKKDRGPFLEMSGKTHGLGLCLVMARSRRFARTEKGRLGLVPFIDSQARSPESRGSAIAIVHGCIVPVVLQAVDEEKKEWKLVGDCYIEGVMHGEAVDWEEDAADTLILV